MQARVTKSLVLLLAMAVYVAPCTFAKDASHSRPAIEHSVPPPSGSATLSPVLSYGAHYQNENPVPKTTTLTNTGSTTITITSIDMNLGDVFYVSGTTCGATLSAGSHCTITVDFSPAVAVVGGNNDILEVTDSAGTQRVAAFGSMRCPVGGCR